jgi:hypothetical protein
MRKLKEVSHLITGNVRLEPDANSAEHQHYSKTMRPTVRSGKHTELRATLCAEPFSMHILLNSQTLLHLPTCSVLTGT